MHKTIAGARPASLILTATGVLIFRISWRLPAVFGVACVSQPGVIPDSNLWAVIADSLGKGADAPITPADMETLTLLSARKKSIRDLRGIEFATNLKELNLSGNGLTGAVPRDLAI